MKYVFETDCIHSTYEAIRALVETLEPVSLSVVYRGVEGLREWALNHGYDSVFGTRGLSMEHDWHLGTFRGVYRGRPALVVVWSAIEFIWVEPRA